MYLQKWQYAPCTFRRCVWWVKLSLATWLPCQRNSDCTPEVEWPVVIGVPSEVTVLPAYLQVVRAVDKITFDHLRICWRDSVSTRGTCAPSEVTVLPVYLQAMGAMGEIICDYVCTCRRGSDCTRTRPGVVKGVVICVLSELIVLPAYLFDGEFGWSKLPVITCVQLVCKPSIKGKTSKKKRKKGGGGLETTRLFVQQ